MEPPQNPAPAEGTRLDLMSEQSAPSPTPAAELSSDPASPLPQEIASALKRDPSGLVAAIVQQHDTNEVLMLGWMDDEALNRTMTSGRVTFYSRSRQEYWRKGDTSGNVQFVRSAALDCDADTLLVSVEQVGPACHTGAHACFDVHPLTPVRGQAE